MAEQHQDLIDMIEVLSTSIDIQTREENFYRRSAGASSSDVARSLFLEIADDSTRYRKSLEDRREKLQEALNDSKVVKGNGMEEMSAGFYPYGEGVSFLLFRLQEGF
jgi:rubrerythrin